MEDQKLQHSSEGIPKKFSYTFQVGGLGDPLVPGGSGSTQRSAPGPAANQTGGQERLAEPRREMTSGRSYKQEGGHGLPESGVNPAGRASGSLSVRLTKAPH